jgi:hypothetical protein
MVFAETNSEINKMDFSGKPGGQDTTDKDGVHCKVRPVWGRLERGAMLRTMKLSLERILDHGFNC